MQDTHNIKRVLQQKLIYPHFQGIINFYTGNFFAFEALTRVNAPLSDMTPDQLFSMAENQGYLSECDVACVAKAMATFKQQHLPNLLFINILPVNLRHIIQSLNLNNNHYPLRGIVFEISERYLTPNNSEFNEQIKTLRKNGASIAIDRLGTGNSSLLLWTEIKPDYIKIDRHFIHNIHKEGIKREFVRSVVEIAKGLRCQVIAECIETMEELDTLSDIGITLGQGYLLHRPEAYPSHHLEKSSYFTNNKHNNLRGSTQAETVENVIEQTQTINSGVNAAQVNDLFKHDLTIRCTPVLKNDIPIGIISRNRLLEIFSDRYSYALYGHKNIELFMEKNPIIVDYKESVQTVAQRVTDDDSRNLNEDFILTKEGKYHGVGKVNTLFKVLTETQIKYAQHSNPLTLLPGNVPMSESIEDLLARQQDFHLAYVDINYFKPFNDHFGYCYGDEVIKKLSNIIIEKTSKRLDLVGHIGGDDFMVIFRSDDWHKRCQSILDDFKTFTLKFYSKEEIANGGIWCQDRRGNREFFSLLSLSIGIVHPDTQQKINHHDVAELATDAKRQAKLKDENSLFVSRRRTSHPPVDKDNSSSSQFMVQ